MKYFSQTNFFLFLFNRPRGPLPKVEEAFTLPIPVELTAKQQQIATTSSTITSLPTHTSTNPQYPPLSEVPPLLPPSTSVLTCKSYFILSE
jgi:hypothetical protein